MLSGRRADERTCRAATDPYTRYARNLPRVTVAVLTGRVSLVVRSRPGAKGAKGMGA
jgi:hypothetical protein